MNFAARLREYRKANKLSVGTLAARLSIAKHRLCAWSPKDESKKATFPPRCYWPALINAGIATEAELLAARPRRKRNWEMFTLAEYAARYNEGGENEKDELRSDNVPVDARNKNRDTPEGMEQSEARRNGDGREEVHGIEERREATSTPSVGLCEQPARAS